MDPEHKIKREIAKRCWEGATPYEEYYRELLEGFDEFSIAPPDGDWEAMTETEVDECYMVMSETEFIGDYEAEFRSGDETVDLPCPHDGGHYEAKYVARQMLDGSWVAWTYYSGGGKHGYPEQIEWMYTAFNVLRREVTRVMKVTLWEEL